MAISEKRSIKMIDEVGTDGHIDSVPNQSTNITGSCQRVRFDRLRVAEAFSRGFVHVASQVYPFDIVIFDKQKLAQGLQIATIIKNVWISGIDYTYQVSDWVITDTMTWEAETIFSILNNGSNTPVAQGGEIGLPFSNIPIERRLIPVLMAEEVLWMLQVLSIWVLLLTPTRHFDFLIILISQYTP